MPTFSIEETYKLICDLQQLVKVIDNDLNNKLDLLESRFNEIKLMTKYTHKCLALNEAITNDLVTAPRHGTPKSRKYNKPNS
tara:strand:+ start:955 stop:1200 length:246 start_codon:yes stop_codon:yes gene_type:complete